MKKLTILSLVAIMLLGVIGCVPRVSNTASPQPGSASSPTSSTSPGITPLTDSEKDEIKNAVLTNPVISQILQNEAIYSLDIRWLAITGINSLGQPLKVPLKEDGTVDGNFPDILPKSAIIYPSVLAHLGNPETRQLRIAVDRQTKQVILMDSLVVGKFIPPSGNFILTVEVQTTLSGTYTYLAVTEDGTITFRLDEGLRFPRPGSEAIRTIKTGQLNEDELTALTRLFLDPIFSNVSQYKAITGTIDSDARSIITFNYQGINKVIQANFNLRHRFLFLPDIASPVKEIFLRLNYIIDFDTGLESRDLIAITSRP